MKPHLPRSVSVVNPGQPPSAASRKARDRLAPAPPPRRRLSLLALPFALGLLTAAGAAALAQVPNIFAGALSGQSNQPQQAAPLPQPATGTATPSSVQTGGQPGSQTSAPNPSDGAQGSTFGSLPQRQPQTPQRLAETNLPPDRETDFQRLIYTTTGQNLPIFGASLFQGAPSTFAPVENIPLPADYVVGPGDEIRLQLSGQVNQQGSFVVNRNGEITIPQLGTLSVAGVSYGHLGDFLHERLSRVYRNFELNVTLGQLRSIQIFIVGQTRRPGSYTVSSLSTLLNALFVSGGPSAQGSLRDIQVRRGAETIVHLDLYDLLLRGDKSHDIKLLPGDVLFVPPVGPQVALLGSVQNAAVYELRGETQAAGLLALSGGESNLAAAEGIRIERIAQHELRSVLEVDQAQLPQTPLQNGDIVTVTSIVDRFRNAVTLRGNVANPGRYVWHTGMRVTDLIPDKEMLLTRNYWLKRSRLGLAPAVVPEAAPTANQGSLGISSTAAPGTGASTSGTRSSSSASGGGSSVAAALSASDTLFTPATDVVLSAPDIDWSYAVIERQDAADLRTSLVPFNLGRAILDHSRPDDPELMPNDVVTIFSTADIRVPSAQQTRFVRLEGEFVGAGVYSVKPGETLRQLVARAGGFTGDAYLYASEFTRQSTRRAERQRLNDFADQLDARVSAATAGTSSRAINDRDAAAGEASATGARAAINRLRQLEPVGRIVLQLKPDSEGLGDLPELALEDGDRFIVPKIPSNVYVEGEVYSANAFLFEPGRRTSTYLKLAGGPDREADKRRSFVLRADGSVLSQQYADVHRALIYPGDTIVVPPIIAKRAILRNLVDISNIIGQFGIGVAAINVLK